MQMEMYEYKLEEKKEYSAVNLSDILKWIDKPFVAMNDTQKENDRVYFCDFKPRKKYIYNGKWRFIKKKRELSDKEKFNFLNIYDRKIKEFRKIDIKTMSFLKVGRKRYRVDQVDAVVSLRADRFSVPKITLKRLP